MGNKEKYTRINDQINRINSNILPHFPRKLAFEKHGSGEYCIILGQKSYKFATLGDVIAHLDFILDLFSR